MKTRILFIVALNNDKDKNYLDVSIEFGFISIIRKFNDKILRKYAGDTFTFELIQVRAMLQVCNGLKL